MGANWKKKISGETATNIADAIEEKDEDAIRDWVFTKEWSAIQILSPTLKSLTSPKIKCAIYFYGDKINPELLLYDRYAYCFIDWGNLCKCAYLEEE